MNTTLELAQEIAQRLGSNLNGLHELRADFRTISRTFSIAFLDNGSALVTSNYSQNWHGLIMETLQGTIQKEHLPNLCYQLVSAYLKGCREGIFPCEADGTFSYLLYTANPEEKIYLNFDTVYDRVA